MKAKGLFQPNAESKIGILTLKVVFIRAPEIIKIVLRNSQVLLMGSKRADETIQAFLTLESFVTGTVITLWPFRSDGRDDLLQTSQSANPQAVGLSVDNAGGALTLSATAHK